MSRWVIQSVVVLVLLTAVPSAGAQAGSLDTAFSFDGKATTNVTSGFDSAYGVAIQPVDAKIVAAGEVAGSGGRFGLVRYDTDGSLDAGFGGDGRVTTNFTSQYDAAGDVVVQGDGRIVAAGIAGGSGSQFALARYNSDGSLDATFGGDGKVTTNFTAGSDFAFGVLVQPDGKIVAAGRAGGSGGRIAVARYETDGDLDPTFDGDGKVLTNFTSGDDRADVVLLDAGGNITVAGTANYLGRNARFALARYTAAGVLDATFGGDGKVSTNFTRGFDGAFGADIQGDGQIIVAGQAGFNLAVARYNGADGSLDSTFGGDGKKTVTFSGGLDYADGVKVQGDGKIVAAGAANFFGRDSKFALARFNSNGSLDTTFDTDGKVVTNFTSRRDGAFEVALQPDGNIVAVGRAAGSGGRFAAARYHST